jgi:hypothetical protein
MKMNKEVRKKNRAKKRLLLESFMMKKKLEKLGKINNEICLVKSQNKES